jgi:hypothetical protein
MANWSWRVLVGLRLHRIQSTCLLIRLARLWADCAPFGVRRRYILTLPSGSYAVALPLWKRKTSVRAFFTIVLTARFTK